MISSEEMHFVSQDTLHPCVFCSFSKLEESSYMHRWVAAVCRPPWKILLHLCQRGAFIHFSIYKGRCELCLTFGFDLQLFASLEVDIFYRNLSCFPFLFM